jgi:CPA1 family monovalent cation:H+ antiporter
MSDYQSICILAVLAFTIAFANQYLLRLQETIAITSGALLLSLLLLVVGKTLWPELQTFAVRLLNHVDFHQFVLHGVLGFLLFAGGLGINLRALRSQKWEITVLVIFGVLFSAVLVAAGLWALCTLFGYAVPFVYCLLFGALISPTDPIAVLAIVKKMGAPEQIAIQLEGEALFNDGVGLVLFLTVYAVAFGGKEPSAAFVAELFLYEVLGGMLFGALLGLVAHLMISATDEGPMELVMTLCIPTAGFAVANMLGVSGALAMVVAGIIIGNWTRYSGFSEQSETFLDQFWHLTDEFLNGLLFLMLGLAMLIVQFRMDVLVMVVCAIPLVLAARFASVGLPYLVFRRFREYHRYSVRILSWGGLRGALSLAMAVSIPAGIPLAAGGELELHSVMVMMTYSIVLFSIIVQGITIAPLIARARRAECDKAEAAAAAGPETRPHAGRETGLGTRWT